MCCLTRQVYNLFQDLWNKFLVFSKGFKNYQKGIIIRENGAKSGGKVCVCVLMFYCGLNNNTFKLFLIEHKSKRYIRLFLLVVCLYKLSRILCYKIVIQWSRQIRCGRLVLSRRLDIEFTQFGSDRRGLIWYPVFGRYLCRISAPSFSTLRGILSIPSQFFILRFESTSLTFSSVMKNSLVASIFQLNLLPSHSLRSQGDQWGHQ